MSRISDRIRSYVDDFDTSEHYGEWGILRKDQRREIRRLCDTCDAFERAADEFSRELMEMKKIGEPTGEADKPLPMAPKYNVKRGALCPSCDGELDMKILRCGLFRRDEIKIREKAPFCKWCGQAIDWRND